MQVSHVEKNMVEVEQSSTVPNPLSIYKKNLNHTLGLTLSTPGLVKFSSNPRFIVHNILQYLHKKTNITHTKYAFVLRF